MERFGDDQAGFSVSMEAEKPVVRVRAWGFWGADVASAFGPAVRGACRARPAGTRLVLDMTDLKPMRDEGQESFATVVGAAAGLGIAGIEIATGSQLTKLQLLRIVAERGAGGITKFV